MTTKIEEVQEAQETQEETGAEELKISSEELGKLNAIRNQMEEMTKMIGTLDIQKTRVVFQHMNAGDEMKRIIRQSLTSVGVDEADIPKYRINMETGLVEQSDK